MIHAVGAFRDQCGGESDRRDDSVAIIIGDKVFDQTRRSDLEVVAAYEVGSEVVLCGV